MRNAAIATVEAIMLQSTAKNDALAAVDDCFKIDFESEFDEAEGVAPDSKEEGIEPKLSSPTTASVKELMAPLTTSE